MASRLNTGATDDDAGERAGSCGRLRTLNFSAEARHHLGELASAVQPDYIGAGVILVNPHTSSS